MVEAAMVSVGWSAYHAPGSGGINSRHKKAASEWRIPVDGGPLVLARWCGNASRNSLHRALSFMGKYGGIKPYTKMQVAVYQARPGLLTISPMAAATHTITMVSNDEKRKSILRLCASIKGVW
jgi:hypothetical protein